MKTIELYRHSTKIGTGNNNLSPEGIELAKSLGATELKGKNFTHFFVSPLSRTSETLEAFRAGAGDFSDVPVEVFPPHLQVSETDEALALWNGPCHAAEQKGEDMMVAAMNEPAGPVIAKKAAEAFKHWIETLPKNSKVLVVGHSPFIELIVFGLFNKQLPQLQPTEGVRITKDQEGLHLQEL